MKHISYLIVSVLAVVLVSCASQKTITILHTNDTHSQILPLSKNLADTMKAGRAGFARRIVMLDEERSKDPELLLFDSGDFCQGSSYYTMFKGDVEVGLMNMMGYDAGTIGNHEFDDGLDNMARLFRSLNFPILCSNYDFSGTPVDGLVKPNMIIIRKGIKIGVFALCPELKGLVDAKNYGPTRYLDPIGVARQQIDYLKSKKCDLIVCLSHLGWDSDGMNDQVLVRGTEGMDVVLGGHSHTYMVEAEHVKDKAGRDVLVDQNGKHGIFIGKLKCTFK